VWVSMNGCEKTTELSKDKSHLPLCVRLPGNIDQLITKWNNGIANQSAKRIANNRLAP
jgi:hypothetical protein